MTDASDVAPLFMPGQSVINSFEFICNIEDELSLWRNKIVRRGVFRVYNCNHRGAFLDPNLVRDPFFQFERVLNGRKPFTLGADTIDLYRMIVKHKEALTVYMAMLAEKEYVRTEI